MFYLIYMLIRLGIKAIWLLFAAAFWTLIAAIVIPTAIVQSCRGRKIEARRTMRALNFGHRYWDPL